MIEEAQPDTEYTSTEIQATFDAEVKKYPELNEAIKQELHRYKQTLPTNEFCLDAGRWILSEKDWTVLFKRIQGAPKKQNNTDLCNSYFQFVTEFLYFLIH
jgi:hypothetical protein